MTAKDWDISWTTVHADTADVAAAKSLGKELSVGDVMWRRATAIGPLEVQHNHWTGWCFDCDDADVLLAASAPRLKEENAALQAENARLRAELHEAQSLRNDHAREMAEYDSVMRQLGLRGSAPPDLVECNKCHILKSRDAVCGACNQMGKDKP